VSRYAPGWAGTAQAPPQAGYGRLDSMSRWADVVAAEPEFARQVREILDAHRHKTLATLRRDGSPRISGIEVRFEAGDVWLTAMPDSEKAYDLRGDPRLALHSASEDPPLRHPGRWPGDAKIAGRGVEVADPYRPGTPTGRFRVDITEVVLTRIGRPADHLIIDSWHPGRGLERRERR
jgi:pyridoxamine 5'-phosphate oxidase-like protein